MLKFSYYVFIVWFVLLPFTVISSMSLGVAVDKSMAPLLILLWFALFLMGNYQLDRKKVILLMVVFSFFFVRNVSFIGDATVYLGLIWEDAIRFGYFSLPVLFINDSKKINPAMRLISFNAMVGCVSVFLVALGLLTLPYERFSQSRIGFEDVQKSIGLFSAYGDLAQYAIYFLLLALLVPTTFHSNKKKLVQIAVISIVIMGLIGTQSRSYFLSVISSLIVASVFVYRSKKTTNTMLINMLIILVSIIMLAITAFMFDDIVKNLMGLGGSQASTTAQGRLGQYEFAFSVIKESPILGVDLDFYLKNGSFGHFVHNMWLGQLVRGGFSSTLILLSILVLVFYRTLGLFNNTDTKVYATLSIGYLAGLSVSTLFYPADSMLFWAMLGMNAAIVYTVRPEVISIETITEKVHSNEGIKQSSILRYRDRNVK